MILYKHDIFPGAAAPSMKREILVMDNEAFIDIFLRYRGVNN